ncbi:hypothetical protein B0H14DRAFT_3484368 [Mycena olivaceomarginata]|nr:hypothetical protein B0H14DRAFT_3484368 [Mycena olivaceomarginata]
MRPTFSFEDALELIHKTIGCHAMTISVCNDTDWEGRLVTGALAKMKMKKDISVDIFVLPENYMLSLRAKNKRKTPTTTKRKGGKAKLTVIDLDNNDSEEGEDNDDEGKGTEWWKRKKEARRNSDDTTDEITTADDGSGKWTRHDAF